MNRIQTDHLNYIIEQSKDLITDKYIKGTIEHQSVLSVDYSAKELLDMAIEEATDQMVYLLTLRSKL